MRYFRREEYAQERQRIMLKYLRHIRSIKIPVPIQIRIHNELEKLRKGSCVGVNGK